MSRAVFTPAAALALAAAAALGTGVAASAVAHRQGYAAGRLDAYRETDRVLRDLEHALAPLVQQQAPAQPDNGRVD